MRFVCDIDGVLCDTVGTEYERAIPRQYAIDYLNKLHSEGHTIIIYSARGWISGLDLYNLTREQLIRWGLEFDELYLNKPAGDFYIDDHNISLEVFQNACLSRGWDQP